MERREMKLADFVPCIGQSFAVSYPGHEEDLVLDEAIALPWPSAPGQAGAEPFRLVFRGESTTIMLAQHIHRLSHPVLGGLDIFLVPCQRNDDGTHSYAATFG
jgi:hypothetical protein